MGTDEWRREKPNCFPTLLSFVSPHSLVKVTPDKPLRASASGLFISSIRTDFLGFDASAVAFPAKWVDPSALCL